MNKAVIGVIGYDDNIFRPIVTIDDSAIEYMNETEFSRLVSKIRSEMVGYVAEGEVVTLDKNSRKWKDIKLQGRE